MIIVGFLLIMSAPALLLLLSPPFGGGDNEPSEKIVPNGEINVSQSVMELLPIVAREAKKNGVEEHTNLILALIMQESGGNMAGTNGDVMQASEALCGYIGCITSVDQSVAHGVKVFAERLQQSNGDIRLTLQSYNFGPGFIGYVNKNGGKYSKELAIEFSKYMMTKVKDPWNYTCLRAEARPYGACYGDILYVDSVLKYYNVAAVTAPVSKGQWALPVSGSVTSEWGWRSDPFTGEKDYHGGMDFGCTNGVTPIYSVDDGVVVRSAVDSNGWGNYVIIQHGKGLYSLYGHMSSKSLSEGDRVQQKQQVGVCGSTGRSTGPHLHFEAKKAIQKADFNPRDLLGL